MATASLLGLAAITKAQEAPAPPSAGTLSVPPLRVRARHKPSRRRARPPTATITPPSGQMKDVRQPTGSERRRAAKLFLSAAKLYEQGKFEEALEEDKKAAELDPANGNYRMAVEVARAHAVTALIQAAAKARMKGDTLGSRATLARAFQLDPSNPQLAQHLGELGENPPPGDIHAQNERLASSLGELEHCNPRMNCIPFTFMPTTRQIIPDVFRAYGIEASLDETIRGQMIRFDIDDATFEQAPGRCRWRPNPSTNPSTRTASWLL